MTPEPIQGAGSGPAPLPAPRPASGLQPRELDLFAFFLMLLRHLPFILGCGLLTFLLMVADMLHAKPRFAATADMIIPQTSSAKLNEAISLNTFNLVGGGYELYADMLRSRSVADPIIADFNLKNVYHTKELQVAEAALAASTSIETQRDGLIRVTVQDTSAKRSADIANDYIHQLDALNSRLVLTSVGEERAYLERELFKEKDTLADAEVALKEVQENTSGVTPEAEANAQLGALETTRLQLRADQVRLDALLTGETAENPEVIRLRSEIAGLDSQLEELQRGQPSSANGTPTSQVPEQVLLYTRRLRDVKFHEELYDLLEKQFEEAKQEEAKNPSVVQILDPAVPAFHKSWPPRTYYCILAGIFGLIVGVLLVSLSALVRSYMRNPENAEKLRQLKTLYRKQMREQS